MVGKAMQHVKHHDCHLEMDLFWQTQSMKCCKGIRDVVSHNNAVDTLGKLWR